MIRHCVMFTFGDDVDDETKAAISEGLDRMAQLECVAAYTHGTDAGLVDGNWDYVVVGDFETADDYRTYAADADHQQLIADLIRPNIASRAAVQFEMAAVE